MKKLILLHKPIMVSIVAVIVPVSVLIYLMFAGFGDKSGNAVVPYEALIRVICCSMCSMMPAILFQQNSTFYMLPAPKWQKFLVIQCWGLFCVFTLILCFVLTDMLASMTAWGEARQAGGLLSWIMKFDSRIITTFLLTWSLSTLAGTLLRSGGLAALLSVFSSPFMLRYLKRVDEDLLFVYVLVAISLMVISYQIYKRGQVANNGILKI